MNDNLFQSYLPNVANTMDSARVYNDLNGLNSIKAQARSNEDAALREISKQFESMFVAQLLKSMRDANDVMFEDNMFSGNETKFYRQMYDDQLALAMSGSPDNPGVGSTGSGIGGFGIADVLFQQLKGEVNGPAIFDASSTPKVLPLSESIRPILNTLRPSVKATVDKILEDVNEKIHGEAGKKIPSFNSPESFVNEMLPLAEKISRMTGMDPKTLVAQAALETGWGKHIMVDDKGNNSFNLFGIKANSAWQGDVATASTLEHDGKQFQPEKAQFRSYSSWEESFDDYLNFLRTNPRYETALRNAADGSSYAKELQAAGYATDPNYAEKIINISERLAVNSLENETSDLNNFPHNFTEFT